MPGGVFRLFGNPRSETWWAGLRVVGACSPVLLASDGFRLAMIAASTGWFGHHLCSNRELTCAHPPPTHSLDTLGPQRGETPPRPDRASIALAWDSAVEHQTFSRAWRVAAPGRWRLFAHATKTTRTNHGGRANCMVRHTHHLRDARKRPGADARRAGQAAGTAPAQSVAP